MSTVMLVPTGAGVGLTTVLLGLERAFDTQGLDVIFYTPISQDRHRQPKTKTALEKLTEKKHGNHNKKIALAHAETLLSEGKKEQLLEEIIANYEEISSLAEIVIVQGLISSKEYPYAARLNYEIYKALDANIIFVASENQLSVNDFNHQLEINARYYDGVDNPKLLGAIINKIDAPTEDVKRVSVEQATIANERNKAALLKQTSQLEFFSKHHVQLLAAIPWDNLLGSPRMCDIAASMDAEVINQGDIMTRRVQYITLCARSLQNMLGVLKEGTLVITAGDRIDIIIATCMAAASGIELAGLMLTGEYPLDNNTKALCSKAFEANLPIITVSTDSYRTVLSLEKISKEVPHDDIERIEKVKEHAAYYIQKDWIRHLTQDHSERRLSPAAFRYQLIQKSRQAKKTIVLPEGEEPRIIKAAQICAERHIAKSVLLGSPERIATLAQTAGFELHPDITVIDPTQLREQYIAPLVALRKHKGMTSSRAKEYLEDNIVLATMLLHDGTVDGLVAGSINTTANTIRPALQLIKVKEHYKLVSSIFFMCLPQQVLVYGDCAVNPDPSAEQLADIAIQSAESAQAFGIKPKIAMISYSTGDSGTGCDVKKVIEATKQVKQRCPELLVDGPLQYDAALNPHVAKTKAPNSPVAGQANVFIFPDLNTGNTTYKAVQRSANVLSIGPMLQGLRKPVNDLSRGATVDDIVFTIAITAIQST